MTVEMNRTKAKEIRNLLFVIGSAVAAALILSLSLLYIYNPSGRYFAKNVLLAPEIMSQISYPEKQTKTGKEVRFTFEGFEFRYWDQEKKEWIKTAPKQKAYSEFYSAVAQDQSIQPISEEMRKLFNQNHLTALTVHMKSDHDKIVFQEVYFDPGGDFYKVQLREESTAPSSTEGWAYFLHPGIERYARALFYP